jgi:hypothetical protein
MIQLTIDPELIVNYDFTAADVNRTLKNLQPVVYRNGDTYNCLLGPSLEEGILGTGSTPELAIFDWEVKLKERIQNPAEDDEVSEFVIDTLKMTKDDVW